jgi:hypothetical protein
MRLRLGAEKAMWAGTYELAVQEELVRLAPRPGVGYDLGPYIGFFSLVLAQLSDSVVAVEPLPANAARVREAAALNNASIEVVEAAASDREGVRSVTLAALARRYGPPSIVKIDVEGAAGLVLRGAGEALDNRPPVLVELHGGDEEQAVARQLTERGYEIRTLGGRWIVAT